MRSVRLQLLVTLLAVGSGGGLLAWRGLPPSRFVYTTVHQGDLANVTRCLNWGIDGSSFCGGGYTLLHDAAIFDQNGVARLLLIRGADPNAVAIDDGAPITALGIAATNQNTELVTLLLDAGADVHGPAGACGQVPLHVACQGRNDPLVQLLIRHGADVCIRDGEGNSPLHHCAASGGVEVIQRLVDAGADVHMKNREGCTPLHFAAWGWLGWWEEMDPVRNERVKLLLKVGADVAARDKLGNTPLHAAVEHAAGRWILELLINAGAEVNARNASGRTPIMLIDGAAYESMGENVYRYDENSARETKALLRKHGATD